MIETKYRVWTDNKMIYPHEYNKNCDAYGHISFSPNNEDGTVGFRIMESEGGWRDDWKEQISMQFIGIKNNGGKEIYEGDIVFEPHRKHKYKIFKVAGGFAINTHQDDLNKDKVIFYTGLSDMQNMSWLMNCEIIGNIYQTPELLTT